MSKNMDIISHVLSVISRGEAIRANGPIEHWLTTLATGFWGFDDSKQMMWSNLQVGDVLIFQAGSPNWTYVERYKSGPKVNGIIGVGVVSRTSRKTDPQWLSEVIDSNVNKVARPKLWPNLVHFSDVIWFGDVEAIPANAVQSSIKGCETATLDLQIYIQSLAQNNLTFSAMSQAEFVCPAMGTGSRFINNLGVLARLIELHAQAATFRVYDAPSPLLSVDSEPADRDPSDYKSLGGRRPSKRKSRNKSQGNIQRPNVKRDYVQEAIVNQKLGSVGELIILEAERKKVSEEFGEQYFSRVVHVSQVEGDGAGYDIRTLRERDGEVFDYYIEVKATTGDENTDFFMSENEIGFANANLDSYEVVRIYSLNQISGSYKEYRLTACELLGLDKIPVSYRVSVR
ncbi:DUF3883 domain-containing protein [Pseudomonas monteilii]